MSTALVISMLIGLFALALFMWMPVMRGEEAFFGVRVNREFYDNEGKRLLHRYYFWLVMTLVEIEAIPFIIAMFRPQMSFARLAWLVLFMPAAQILYIVFYQKVKPYAIVDENQKFASALINRKLADYTSIGLEILIAVAVLAPVPVLAYFYPDLPDKIPVHWDLRGVPNRWAPKSFGSVFSAPIMMIYLQGMMLLIKHGLMQAKMTLPAQRTKEYLQSKEEVLKVNMQMIDIVRLFLSLMMGAISLSIIVYVLAPSNVPLITAAIFGLALLTMITTGYFIYRMMIVNRKMKEKFGRSYVQRQSDADRWYWGGLIYYNPDDPALMVEKLVGVGYTFNMGNKRVYLYLGYIALLPILIRFILLG